MNGPDHKGLNPKEFKSLVDNIRKVETMLGSSIKKITKSEKKYQNCQKVYSCFKN